MSEPVLDEHDEELKFVPADEFESFDDVDSTTVVDEDSVNEDNELDEDYEDPNLVALLENNEEAK